MFISKEFLFLKELSESMLIVNCNSAIIQMIPFCFRSKVSTYNKRLDNSSYLSLENDIFWKKYKNDTILIN